jgi:hypothetical protein
MKKIFFLFLIVICIPLFGIRGNSQTQWELVYTNNGQINCFAVSGTNIFAGTYGVLISGNKGTYWHYVSSGLENKLVLSFAVSGSNIFSGVENIPYNGGGGVFLSTNNGEIWTAVNNGFPTNLFVNALAFLDTKLFAGTQAGIVLSTNNGNNWSMVNNGPVVPINSFTVSGSRIFAGTNNGVYLSTDYGSNWFSVGLSGTHNDDITVIDSTVFAAATIGVYSTTNNGVNWNPTGLMDQSINHFAVSRTFLFAGSSNGLFLSVNNGLNWSAYNQGINVSPMMIFALKATDNYIFAGIVSNYSVSTIWRRSISDLVNVQNISSENPSMFSLSQNYPNPFNPVTKIKYSIPSIFSPLEKGGLRGVNLKVFDILGRVIETLVNEKQNPGTYEVTFDGSRLSSGIYFYTLTAGDFKETKKLILLK